MLTFQAIGDLGWHGNQLFQYATLLGITTKLGFECGVPYSNPNFTLPKVFSNLSAKDTTGVLVTKRLHEREPFIGSGILLDGNVFAVEDGTDLHGYFQCEKYFLHVRETILKEFALDDSFVRPVNDFLSDVRSKYGKPLAFASFRVREDYQTSRIHRIVPLSYYEEGIKLLGDVHVITTADDIDWCKANFAGENITHCPFVYEEWRSNQAFLQLEIMRQCDHGVIAPSSFSWWGAWLGNNPGRKIISPLQWFKHIKNARPFQIHCNWITI